MTNSRKILAAALAATMVTLSVSTPASAWGRYGYSYYGSGYPAECNNYGYYGAGYSASVASEGYYCATTIKTCLLSEPGWLGTGCSCKVPGGIARGIVE